jgi:acetyltransferase
MAIRNLHKIFRPKSIAVVGASEKPLAVGHVVLKNLIESGFSGPIYPINPKHEQLLNLPVFPNVGALPECPDLAVICTPAATVPDVVRQCGEAGIRGIIIISAGFREVGPEGAALEEAVKAEAARFEGLRIVGPNCVGVLAPHAKMNASFAHGFPKRGHVAFLSQSGALCTSVLDWALEGGMGFSHFVSIGNAIDVGMGDLIDYFANDGLTDAIILYAESVTDAREFLSAARAFTRRKPIIAYKAGRFAQSAKAAASHTGALAGVDAVYEAAFHRAGIVRVFDVVSMFYCAEVLARGKTPRGDRLAIVTNAGGPGVMATDALLARGGQLATLSANSMEELNDCLPPVWSHGNPIDVIGDADSLRFARALEIVLDDPGVDAVLVILTPQAMTDPTLTAQEVARVAKRSQKPVLTAWMGGQMVREGIRVLDAAGVPTCTFPEEAVGAFMALVQYARSRETLYETPRDVPLTFSHDRAASRAVFQSLAANEKDMLSEITSKALLEAYHVPVTSTLLARTSQEAVQRADQLGYPVVLKVYSPDITHKTEVNGVMLNLATAADVSAAYDRVIQNVRERRPQARIEGVTVQPMAAIPGGVELIVGVKRDPVFGAVLLVGAGGVTAELFQDCALELPPLSERLARRMLESLRSWPLLQGYRGRPRVNIERLIEVLMRVSYLAADYPEIQELDINPLLVGKDDLVAVDARVLLDRAALSHPARPYSHLAIRPYPEEWVRQATLEDGTRVLLRPIKPEDEPMWHELLANCSRESLWFRFRYVFKGSTHDMATRYCYIDYDREIAIVAELEVEGRRQLIGVLRLVSDADHRDAEYAILVVDAWQGKGLGGILTDFGLEICKAWGIRRVVAETSPDNNRMLHVFRTREFTLDYNTCQDVVLGWKELESHG